MRFSAILWVLLVLPLCLIGCDRNTDTEDPWQDLYGSYTGQTELYLPVQSETQDDSLGRWKLTGELRTDSIIIAPLLYQAGSGVGSERIRIYWYGAGKLDAAGVNNPDPRIYDLNYDGYWVNSSSYKSNLSIRFIPRGVIYPQSGYKLDRSSGAIGLETFEGHGLYFFDFNTGTNPDSPPYQLFIFTGIKKYSNVSAGGGWRNFRLWSPEKLYPAPVTP